MAKSRDSITYGVESIGNAIHVAACDDKTTVSFSRADGSYVVNLDCKSKEE